MPLGIQMASVFSRAARTSREAVSTIGTGGTLIIRHFEMDGPEHIQRQVKVRTVLAFANRLNRLNAGGLPEHDPQRIAGCVFSFASVLRRQCRLIVHELPRGKSRYSANPEA